MKTLWLVFGLLTCSGSLSSQNAPLACEGHHATVRISEITAKGTVQGFMNAVAAHRAWVFSHGLIKDEITTVPLIVRDERTGARNYSTKQFLSIHVHGSNDPGPKHDEAYDAFVKMYRDNSDIKPAYDVCLPNNSLK